MGTTEDENRAALRAVSVMFFANGAALASWAARVPAVQRRLDVDNRTLGLVLLASAAGALLAFRVAGLLIARFGSRGVTRVASLAFAVSLPLPALGTSPALAALALGVFGATSGLMDVAMNAQGVEVETRRGQPTLSFFHALFSLGGLVGSGMGALAARFEIPVVEHLSIAALLLATLVGSFGSGLLRTGRVSQPVRLVRPSLLLLGLGALAFCSSVGEGAMGDWLAIYMQPLRGGDASLAALGYGAFSFAMLGGRFGGDRLTARWGPVSVVRASGTVVALGFGIALLLHTLPAAFLGSLCVGLGLSVIIPIVFRAGGSLPNIGPGAGIATVATLGYSGLLVGPPLIGALAGHWTLRVALSIVPLLALAIVLLAPIVQAVAPRKREQ